MFYSYILCKNTVENVQGETTVCIRFHEEGELDKGHKLETLKTDVFNERLLQQSRNKAGKEKNCSLVSHMMLEKAIAYIAIPSLTVPLLGLNRGVCGSAISHWCLCHCHVTFFNQFMFADQKIGFLLLKQEVPFPNKPGLTPESSWFPLTKKGIPDARIC